MELLNITMSVITPASTWLTGMVLALLHMIMVRRSGPRQFVEYDEFTREFWEDGIYMMSWPGYAILVMLYGHDFRHHKDTDQDDI